MCELVEEYSYNMNGSYSKRMKLSNIELFKEILNETENNNIESTNRKSTSKNDNELYQLIFHNSKRTSIQDKLKDKLNFDISPYMGERVPNDDFGKQQRYDCMRLLKLLYRMEKFGNRLMEKNNYWKNARTDMKNRIPIIDIISEPHFANIDSGFESIIKEDQVNYYKIIDYLIDEVALGLRISESDKETLEQEIEELDDSWLFLTSLLSFDSELIKNEDVYSVHRLDRIQTFVETQYLDKIEPFCPKCEKETGVLLSFYNYLVCHKMLCKQAEIINNRYKIVKCPNVTEEYTNRFLQLINQKVKVEEVVDSLTKALNSLRDCSSELNQWKEMWDLITYGKGIDSFKKSKLIYCIGKVTKIIEWINHSIEAKQNLFPPFVKHNKEEVSKWEVISIMQELIYSDWSTIIQDGWFGNRKKYKKTLGSALKSSPDPVTIQAWIFQIENRTIINLNAFEFLEKRRELEMIFYRLKKIMFSTHTYEDMKLVHYHYMHFIKRYVILGEKEVEELFLLFFENIWKKHMRYARVENITYSSFSGFKGWRILALEFPPENLIPFFVDLSRKCKEAYLTKTKITIDILVPTDGCEYDYGIRFRIRYDGEKQLMTFDSCMEIMSNESAKRLIQLGYGNIVFE